MESTASIEEFHEELQSWKHELSSIKHEIRHFEHRLEQLPAHKAPKNLLAQVEHFQNTFICQKEVLDKLRHDLPDSRHKVENVFNSFRTEQENALNERMDIFRRLYDDVKGDFERFQSSWL
jgi:predicted  nucleic acid-binding Zn-ribbon protein